MMRIHAYLSPRRLAEVKSLDLIFPNLFGGPDACAGLASGDSSAVMPGESRGCAVPAATRQLKIERIAFSGKTGRGLRLRGTKIGFPGVDILHR